MPSKDRRVAVEEPETSRLARVPNHWSTGTEQSDGTLGTTGTHISPRRFERVERLERLEPSVKDYASSCEPADFADAR